MNLKFGIIGLGRISSRFAKVLNTVEGVELFAVASSDQARTQKFAEAFGAKIAAANYDALINNPEVDIIYIGLTNHFHYEFTKKCLEAHKSVLCEKPLVITLKEAEELVALAKKNNTFLMEAMWTRCLPAFLKAREWVRSGKIGQVKMINSGFCVKTDNFPMSRIFSQETDDGSLYDLGIYPIDLAIGILGEYPQSVSGSASFTPSGINESSVFSMKFASGVLANLSCSFNVNTAQEATLYGTAGYIVLENCYSLQTCIRYDETGREVEKFTEPVPDGFVYQIRHCRDLLKAGKIESDLIPWADTLASSRVFDLLNAQW